MCIARTLLEEDPAGLQPLLLRVVLPPRPAAGQVRLAAGQMLGCRPNRDGLAAAELEFVGADCH